MLSLCSQTLDFLAVEDLPWKTEQAQKHMKEVLSYVSYLAIFILLYVLTSFLFHKAHNLPPSPFPSLPILGHLYLLKRPLHRTLSKLSSKHGPIVYLRFGTRTVLLVSSPSLAEECFNSRNDVVFANRPRLLFGKIIGCNFASVVWAPYGNQWRSLRRISTVEILSTQRLQVHSNIRTEEVRSLIRSLNKIDAGDRPADMRVAFFQLTLNMMMRMIAGKRFYDDGIAISKEASSFTEMVTETFRLAGASNLVDYLPVLRWFGSGRGMEKRMWRLHAKFDRFLQELIDEYKGKLEAESDDGSDGGERKKTMVEVLLSLDETELGDGQSKDGVTKGLIRTLLLAGADTTTTTMEWAMSLLLNHPDVLKKAQAEIDDHVGNRRLITEADLDHLPYLRCITNETFRMYPAGPLLVPHESSENCIIGGYSIPCGTMLLVNIWDIQNNPKIWDEPRSFKPERFGGQEKVGRIGFRLMPFGTGRRVCPGENLAVRMIGLTLGSLIQCFDWERVGEEPVDMREGPGLSMPKVVPLLAKCTPRPEMLNMLSAN